MFSIKKNSEKLGYYRDITVGYISLISSIISIIAVIAAIYYSKWDITTPEVIFILVFLILALVFADLYLMRKYDLLYKAYNDAPFTIANQKKMIDDLENKLQLASRAQYKIAQTFHNFSHKYRNEIIKLYEASLKEETGKAPKRDFFHGFIYHMIANIKEIFDVLTGTECAVCIKLLTQNSTVKTLRRDAISERERSEIDIYLMEYLYSDNTAFKVILDENDPRTYYLENNLESDHNYRNSNQKWRKYYNACLVAPIRYTVDEEGGQKSYVIGFICVDNKKGNFNQIGVDVLASYADHCYYLFSSYFKEKGLR